MRKAYRQAVTTLVLTSITPFFAAPDGVASGLGFVATTLTGATIEIVPATGVSFSVEGFPSPSTALLDSFVNVLITEGDILTVGLPGSPGPNSPLPGPLPSPGTMLRADVGAPLGSFGEGLGIFPSALGCWELDALSYGKDVLTPTSVGFFSVDEFATGVAPGGVAPDVFSEGSAGAMEASADVFMYLGPFVTTPPGGPVFGNLAAIDGDGLGPSGAPGVGLVEPNPPGPGLPDAGDNLDALDIDTAALDPAGIIYFSLDTAFPDPLEPLSVSSNCGTAIADGFSGADVLVSVPLAFPALAIPAAALGLDISGADTDDFNALIFDDADGSQTLTPGDSIYFSVRRGSAVIGRPDSAFAVPIEEGDILTVPAFLGGNPAIFIAAEAGGLATVRSGTALVFGDDVDALDVPEPGFGLQLAAGLAFLATVGRRRRVGRSRCQDAPPASTTWPTHSNRWASCWGPTCG